MAIEQSEAIPETYGFPNSTAPIVGDAVDFLVEVGQRYRGQLDIVAIGPLTNIAAAILKEPEYGVRGVRGWGG